MGGDAETRAARALDLCRAWLRRVPNPVVVTPRVEVALQDALALTPEGIAWAVTFVYKDAAGLPLTVAAQPVLLVPAAHLEDPRLPAYLDAVARALVEIMTTVGTLRFEPAAALAGPAATADALAAEIVRTNPPDPWS